MVFLIHTEFYNNLCALVGQIKDLIERKVFTNITVMSSCGIMVVITETNINDNIKSRQIKHQLDATLCRFYFCRVILHVSGVRRPSSGVQDCTYSNRHLSNRYCCLLASWCPLASRQQYLTCYVWYQT